MVTFIWFSHKKCSKEAEKNNIYVNSLGKDEHYTLRVWRVPVSYVVKSMALVLHTMLNS